MKNDPIDIFRKYGGQLRMSAAIEKGISRYMLYSLLDKGIIERIDRGIYRLTELPPVGNPDLIIVASRIPNSVVCLVSALSFHEITTQIPHEISIAIPKNSTPASIHFPPVKIHKFSNASFKAGIEEHQIDGINVKVYSAEKTLADCFKFRNKIGMDIVLEALKLYRTRMKFDHRRIMEYAKICRIDKILKPYLEAML